MSRRSNYKWLYIFLPTLLSGCELLCQAGSATCGLTNEQIDKLLHPKTYGRYWTKSGMTEESWQYDWTSCGGMKSGQYSGDAPSGSTTQMIIESEERERRKLSKCMQSKGYEYRNDS